jgi:hypothetical protein
MTGWRRSSTYDSTVLPEPPPPVPTPPAEALLAMLDELDPDDLENIASGCDDFSVSQGALYLRIIREKIEKRARRGSVS